MNFVQPTISDAKTYGPHADLGKVWALPAFVRGIVVDSATGAPVQGVFASMRDVGDLNTIVGSDTTNANGVFRIYGLEGEDFGLKINGSAKGYETGWVGCTNQVWPTWGEACGAPLGKAGKIFLDQTGP